MQLKAQSAMEYLMTYGWAILIIAVVLASLFSLGVFNSGASLSTACIPLAGFTCSGPVLHNGNLTIVEIGQATGQAWLLTGLYLDPTGTTGCASAVNSIPPSPLPIASGGSGPTRFQGLPTTVGASFSGTLWAGYNTATVNGLCVQLASLSVKAT